MGGPSLGRATQPISCPPHLSALIPGLGPGEMGLWCLKNGYLEPDPVCLLMPKQGLGLACPFQPYLTFSSLYPDSGQPVELCQAGLPGCSEYGAFAFPFKGMGDVDAPK